MSSFGALMPRCCSSRSSSRRSTAQSAAYFGKSAEAAQPDDARPRTAVACADQRQEGSDDPYAPILRHGRDIEVVEGCDVSRAAGRIVKAGIDATRDGE